MRDKNFSKDLDNLIGGMNKPSTPPQQVRTAEDIAALAKEHLKHNYAKAPNQSQDEANYIQDVAEINWARGFKAAMELYRTQPEEREAVGFFTMQQFPTQEPGETFSKTVLIYNKEDNSFCDLGYYDFETSEWAILGDMSMKLICWCYIPDASTFINGKELKEELHRGYR